MKLNMKYKYFGDPVVCSLDPVPGRDPPFGKRCSTAPLPYSQT